MILSFSTLYILLTSLFANHQAMKNATFYKSLEDYCVTLETEFNQIPEARQKQLRDIGAYIADQTQKHAEIAVTVICTHNSRRSHMGQLWIRAAAAHYGLEDIITASGGTEATAFNPRAVHALQQAGFNIARKRPGDNPLYHATYGPDDKGVQMFSKKYDHKKNPSKDFAAIMVCTDADEACPIVPGADARFAIPYKDPKYADNTSEEEEAYARTCRMIAREMFYVIHHAQGLVKTHPGHAVEKH